MQARRLKLYSCSRCDIELQVIVSLFFCSLSLPPHPVCLLAGRTKAIRKFHEHTSGYQDAEINARLVAYCSDQAHSSVEKAALIGLVRMRFIEADENLSLRGPALREAIEEDIKNGLIPFWVSFTCVFFYLTKLSRRFVERSKTDISRSKQICQCKKILVQQNSLMSYQLVSLARSLQGLLHTRHDRSLCIRQPG